MINYFTKLEYLLHCPYNIQHLLKIVYIWFHPNLGPSDCHYTTYLRLTAPLRLKVFLSLHNTMFGQMPDSYSDSKVYLLV